MRQGDLAHAKRANHCRGHAYSMAAISIQNLVKTYDGKAAVNGTSFDVKQGETFALLGPNGAGKTTTIEILEGYRQADSGDISVLGLDPQVNGRELRRRTGLVLQTTALEPELTVEETIHAFARLYPSPRDIESVLADVDLMHLRGKRVVYLSGGQKRRLEIALGIVGDPELVFLDEPTTGLDPEARRQIWRLIRRLNESGVTIVLSSHYMDEVKALADQMVIMVNGSIVAEGSPEGLQKQHCKFSTIRFDGNRKLLEKLPAALRKVAQYQNKGIEVQVQNPADVLPQLIAWAKKTNTDLSSIAVTREGLEDIYLNLVAASSDKEAS